MHPLSPRAAVPIGFAHRGGATGRRENTLEAFEAALRQGAAGLESDAWITADGEVVLHHDGAIGPFWRRRRIPEMTRRELPRQVPALRDLYRRCGTEFELSLDVKDPAAATALLAEADTAAATARLWLCHADWRRLAGWRGASAHVRLVNSTRLADMAEGLAARTATVREAGIDVINLHRTDWTAERVAAVHAAGLRAFAWDAQTRRQLAALLRMEVDGIYSDHTGLLVETIAAGEAGAERAPKGKGGPPEQTAR